MNTPIKRRRSAVSRLTLTRQWHPERTDFTDLERDCVVERAEYQIRKLLGQYSLDSVTYEQAEYLKGVLLGVDAELPVPATDEVEQ